MSICAVPCIGKRHLLMPKLRVGCHAEVMLHQPRGQIPPLTPSLTCLDAFRHACEANKQFGEARRSAQRTQAVLQRCYLLWGWALALPDFADLPEPLPLLQPRDGTNHEGWVVDIACHKGRCHVSAVWLPPGQVR